MTDEPMSVKSSPRVVSVASSPPISVESSAPRARTQAEVRDMTIGAVADSRHTVEYVNSTPGGSRSNASIAAQLAEAREEEARLKLEEAAARREAAAARRELLEAQARSTGSMRSGNSVTMPVADGSNDGSSRDGSPRPASSPAEHVPTPELPVSQPTRIRGAGVWSTPSMRSDASSGRREEHVPPTEQENKDAEIEELHKKIAQLEAQRVTTSDVDRSARSTSTAATTFMTPSQCVEDLIDLSTPPRLRLTRRRYCCSRQRGCSRSAVSRSRPIHPRYRPIKLEDDQVDKSEWNTR